ncbi:protein-L-isoaspartate(D-aspartate) O-methyltransferase [Betaproteobacteria bacterium SCN2]|jgi:protein-L-isoaspartate(D-aspartate) O-methyltransferase|nr:protein-L-isoaspartate(D-aspartate) O-methyltransferase [Betaproteobacteria bacterium SCN2]
MINARTGIGMTSARTRGRMVERLREQGIADTMVLAAMGMVPRHLFIDEALASRAYEDTALPIGFGQTISNPYIVARMTELARNGRELHRVLEIGTGCGYQAAVLAQVAREVVSIERIAALVGQTRKRQRELRLYNIKLKHGDGMQGYAEGAPYDAIVVAAAFGSVPEALKLQLADGGRLVMPLGDDSQVLLVVNRKGGEFAEERLETVKFVPLLPGVS